MDRVKRARNRITLFPKPGCFTSNDESCLRWSNEDLDPIPRASRTWEWYHVGGFWIAEGFSVAVMQIPSSTITLGLNPGLAMVACLIGNLLVAIPSAANSYIGTKYGTNFPVLVRASFGMYGSYLVMVIRGVICIIWYGVQSILGGQAVQCMITAIWPSFRHWHTDSLPASASIDAPLLLSFSIFWILSIPTMFMSIPALRYLFVIKMFAIPLLWVALFTWAVTAAGGWGDMFKEKSVITDGSSVGFMFCTAITASIGSASTLAVNMPDITRYAKGRHQVWIAQLTFLPFCITLTELLGTVMASSAAVIYGSIEWNPLNIILMWDNRAGQFFAGLLIAFANIVTNVTGNSIPFANDLMGLFPRYINIRRGQLICAILGFAITPWNIEAKATRFLAFLNGYSVFLGPITGIALSDYYFVRRDKRGYNLENLYKLHGIYYFWKGINWRAMVAFIGAAAPLFPGLSHSVSGAKVSQGILNLYTMSWLVAVVFSATLYTSLAYIFPFPIVTEDGVDRGEEYLNSGSVGLDSEVNEELIEASEIEKTYRD